MGESLVETPKVENKMSESVPCLQESVSFGRFEHDSLCWERWSTFPTNKYLEEVEKCSTPGSVAQKKAYFEAHYKRIAARKAELLDLEKKRETELMSSEDHSQTSMGSACNTSEEELDVVKSNNQNPASGTELEDEEEFTREVIDAHTHVLDYGEAEVFDERNELVNFTSDFSEHIDEELSDGVDITDENMDLQPELVEFGGDLCPQMESPPGMEKAELVFVEEEVSATSELQDVEELPRDKEREFADREAEKVVELNGLGTMQEEFAQDKVEEREISELQAEDVKKMDNSKKTPKELPENKGEEREVAKNKTEDMAKSEKPRKMQKELPQDRSEERKVIKRETKAPTKLGNPKKMQKEMPAKRTTNATTTAKKKPESPMPKKSSPMPKSPMLSTPKSLKPVLSKSVMSTTRPSVKKENGFTPLTSKKATRPETKRVLPTSLHMSFSLGPANSDPSALMTTRKSLIMEKMGDKEIVKRAFKAFQNFNHLSPSCLTKAPATNQLGNKKIEKGSALDISKKKHEGTTRAMRPSSPVPRQAGLRKTAVSPGLHKTLSVDQRNGKSIPASLGSRSQDKGQKQKEVPNNIEQKSKTKEAGKTHLQTQSKVKLEKPTPIKTSSQDVSSKAKLSSSYNQGHGFLRGLRKNDTKIQASGR